MSISKPCAFQTDFAIAFGGGVAAIRDFDQFVGQPDGSRDNGTARLYVENGKDGATSTVCSSKMTSTKNSTFQRIDTWIGAISRRAMIRKLPHSHVIHIG